MYLQILKSKLHRAHLTFCRVDYEGSIAVDQDLMDLVGILPGEKVLVVNSTNGARLETYVIPAKRGSRTFGLNGAAARLGQAGDDISLMAFALVTPEEAATLQPRMALLNAANHVVRGPAKPKARAPRGGRRRA